MNAMRRVLRRLATSLLIANLVHSTPGYGQNGPPNTPHSSPAACPAPADVGALHLYGEWLATGTGGDTPATLRLGHNPEHPDGVRGTLRRGTAEILVAGDVDDGTFTLEESSDGRSIAATWTGNIMENTCGKEIQGTWTPASGSTGRPFILRKQPGWR